MISNWQNKKVTFHSNFTLPAALGRSTPAYNAHTHEKTISHSLASDENLGTFLEALNCRGK